MKDVSGSNTLPGRGFSNIGFGAEGVDESFTLNICVCDYDFLKTLKLELAGGASDSLYLVRLQRC